MLWLAVVRQHADVIISDIDKIFQTFRCTYVAVLVLNLTMVTGKQAEISCVLARFPTGKLTSAINHVSVNAL